MIEVIGRGIRTVSRSGLRATDSYQDRRGILLTNYISLTLSAALVMLFVTRRFIFGHIPGGITLYLLIIGLIAFLTPLVLNWMGLRKISRILICYSPIIFVWYAYVSLMMNMSSIEQSVYDSLRINLLGVCFVPYLVLNKKQPLLLMLGILPSLLSLLIFDLILSQFGLGITERGVPDEEYFLVGIRTFVAYFIISISCFIFQSIITYNDDLNRKILAKLKLQSELIKSQNEELVLGQERLNEINHHLEDLVQEKTKSIKEQNKLLLKYAHSNAHHVRGPVARLLGLIQVSRMKTDLDYPWFFEKVEHEAKDVDKIITGIAKDLDDIGPSDKV